jgi:arylsulfatase A-like enzyme
MDPHAPYDPPHEFRGGADAANELTAADHQALRPENHIPYLLESVRQSFIPSMPRQFEAMSAHGKSAMRRLYEGECRYADAEIARLVESVRKRFPDTLFIITSDHGEQFWEHGGMGHGLNLFEEVLHVPLLFLGPGIAPAGIEEPVSTIGLYKTLVRHLALSNEAAPAGIDLLSPSLEGRPVFAATRGPEPAFPIDLQSVRAGPGKLIHDRLTGDYAGYDLQADPREQSPISATEDERSRQLQGYLKHHNAFVVEAVATSPEPDRSPLDASALEQLEALGYIGGNAE